MNVKAAAMLVKEAYPHLKSSGYVIMQYLYLDILNFDNAQICALGLAQLFLCHQ